MKLSRPIGKLWVLAAAIVWRCPTVAAAVLLVLSVGAADAVTIDLVPVGNPGNPGEQSRLVYGDATYYGGVDYPYLIGKYEITNAQWREFLNVKASLGDPYGLYNTSMGGTGDDEIYGGIARGGSGTVADPWVYYPKNNDQNWDNHPVNYVSFWDAARFCNWLHNGQGSGDTESGAYINIGDRSAFARQPGALYFIPTENEWYKAAYHKNDGVTGNYWDYPTGSDTTPKREAPPGTNLVYGSANYFTDGGGYLNLHPYYTMPVGAYTAKPSTSPYGTFDQGGNLAEWTETATSTSSRRVRGGFWVYIPDNYLHASWRGSNDPVYESYIRGFRVASVEPALIWDGQGDGDWSDDRWDADGRFPTHREHASVNTSLVTVTGAQAARTLTITSGGVAIPGPADSLTVSSSVHLHSGATLAVGPGATLSADNLATAGRTTVADGGIVWLSGGAEVAAGGALQVAGTLDADILVQVAAGATLSVAGTLTADSLTTAGTNQIGPGALISVSDALTVDSPLDLTAATLSTQPGVTSIDVGAAGTLIVDRPLVGADLNVAGTVETAGADLPDLNVTPGGVFRSSADVLAQNVNVTGGAIHLSGGGNLHVGTMQVTGCTVDTASGQLVVSRALKIADGATFSITGGSFQLSGPNVADPAQSSELTLTGGRLTVAGGFTPPGAIAIWKFETQDGPTTPDSSTAGNDHLGTLAGSTSLVDDPERGSVLSFAGDGYLQAAGTDDIELGRPFTIALWIKTSQKGATLVGKGHGDHNWQSGEKALYLDGSTGGVSFARRFGGLLNATTNVADGQWHQVVVTYNGSMAPGDQEIYVDAAGQTANRFYNSVLDNGEVFRLGWGETNAGGGYFEYIGLMDDVYLYDRSLSEAEVAQLYQYGAFGSLIEPPRNTNLRVRADSALCLEITSGEATFGNLVLDRGVRLELSGATLGVGDLRAGDGSSVQGSARVRGILSPGDGPATLSVAGQLTLDATSTYEWDLASPAADLVAVEGDLRLGDGWTLRLSDAGGVCTTSEQLDLFTYTGSLSWGTCTIDASQVLGSGRWDWSAVAVNYDGNRVYLTGLTVVPEPSTLVGLIGMCAVALLGYSRRRRAKQPCDV